MIVAIIAVAWVVIGLALAWWYGTLPGATIGMQILTFLVAPLSLFAFIMAFVEYAMKSDVPAIRWRKDK